MSEAVGQPDEVALVALREVLRMPADKYGRRLRLVLDEIHKLHQVPAVPPIEVRMNKDRDLLGQYVKHLGTGKPLRIEISRYMNDRMELTFAHEVGHFLEGAVIPGSPFGTRNWDFDTLTQGWRDAVQSTDSYQRLLDAGKHGSLATTDQVTVLPGMVPKYRAYLLEYRELWARSYAQYVADRSRNTTLCDQLRPRCFPRSPVPIQWNDTEFEPVAYAIDAIFDRLGWRR